MTTETAATTRNWLTVKELARRLDVSKQTVLRWITSGARGFTTGGAPTTVQLVAELCGREYRIEPADLEAFRAARVYPSHRPPAASPAESRRRAEAEAAEACAAFGIATNHSRA